MSLRGGQNGRRGNLPVQWGRMKVYILTNKNHTVLYTGVTNDLVRRVYEHKSHADPKSFTAKYKTDRLVYFEETCDVKAAIER